MKIVSSKGEIRREIAKRRPGAKVALVPTMGYLHEGHLALVDRARERADVVVLSIFVNPLQFGAGEDLERYPRDLERDAALARARDVDLIFAPSALEMYPHGEPAVQVAPLRLADTLCGASRPGHFQGMLTVVAKLFQIVQPDVAIFGQKDFQQAVLIQRMVDDLDIPVEIEVAPIVREGDGLALSSRNVYLSPEERLEALALPRALEAACAAFAEGERDAERLKGRAHQVLERTPALRLQYLELVDRATLDALSEAGPGAVLAIAAHVGRTRLIDNVILR